LLRLDAGFFQFAILHNLTMFSWNDNILELLITRKQHRSLTHTLQETE